jgi:hypothetical protein
MPDTSVIVSKETKQYRTRKPQYSSYYQCIEDNYEIFERGKKIILKGQTLLYKMTSAKRAVINPRQENILQIITCFKH